MNTGQMLLALGAIMLLSKLAMTTNSHIAQSHDTIQTAEEDIAAISIATSIVEEASGKIFDEVITDTTVTSLTSVTQLSSHLGRDGNERFRDTAAVFNGFDDFDDFDGLFLVYKSNLAADAAPTQGSDYEFVVPDIRAKYFVHTKVEYVNEVNLDQASAIRTWHKKLTVTVTSPTSRDTLVFPSIMSYWN